MSRFAFVWAAGLALVLAAPAWAVPPAVGQVQPDSLPLGTLYTDGIAEASFMILAPADDPKPKIKVDAPKFVKVLHTGTHLQQAGVGNNFTAVTVEVAIDTARTGEFAGEIKVTIGEMVTKLPVSATVKARRAGTPRVLVVGTPFHSQSTGDGKLYKGWTDLVDSAGLDVSYLLVRKPVLRDLDLGKYDCVLLGPSALVHRTADDVKRARAYAENGGRVVVTANAFYMRSVKGANEVLDGYGLEMKDVEARGPTGEVVVKKHDFAPEVVKAGIESAKFYRASPVRVEKDGRVLVAAVEFPGTGMGYAVTAKAGKGEVVALGESLWWAWVSEKKWAAGSDNAKLLGWLLAPSRKG